MIPKIAVGLPPQNWGNINHTEMLAPEVAEVSCEGHGGFFVSKKGLVKMPPAARVGEPARTGMWFEEDCMWFIPPLAFYEDLPADHRFKGAFEAFAGSIQYMREHMITGSYGDPPLAATVAWAEKRLAALRSA